ncbi:GATOR complex protein MIOS [Balamuthia mandrillaris]
MSISKVETEKQLVPSSHALSQRRKLAQWSPTHFNQFVIGSADLRLYEISPLKDSEQDSQPGSSPSRELAHHNKRRKGIKLLSVNSEVHLLKCLAWCPDVETTPNLLAVGLPNGKVVLTSFSGTNSVVKEFIPRNSRSCNALAWNPVYKNQLAAGLGKVRCDFSTLVWDINQTGPGTIPPATPPMRHSTHSSSNVTVQANVDTGNFSLSQTKAADTVMRPMGEVNMSEATVALAWVPNQPSCLATGTGAKWLRIYDLRASDLSARKSVIAHSKAVHGVSFDPFKDDRLFTFSEDGVIKIWDIRKLRDCVYAFQTGSKGLVQVEWCPTRSSILASISKEDKTLKLWDLMDVNHSTRNFSDTLEDLPSPSSVTQKKAPKSARVHEASDVLSSFAWHPSKEYRILTVTNNSLVEVVSLHESIPISWSPYGDIAFAYGRQLIESGSDLQVHNPTPPTRKGASVSPTAEWDISSMMRQRAINGYSMNIEKNKLLCEAFGNAELKACWFWLSSLESYKSNGTQSSSGGGTTKTPLNQEYPSILSILSSESQESETKEVEGQPGASVYSSPTRQLCMRMCGWDFVSHSFEDMMAKLERKGQFERAAAMAVFHLNIRRAILSLQRGVATGGPQKQNWMLVAMALSGYDGNSASGLNPGLWKETCSELVDQFQSSYLKACFEFLSSPSKTFTDILLHYDDMSLRDRIAFACRFLPDTELKTYITEVTNLAIKGGKLEGMLLTGLTPMGVDLLESYINITGDVQTACLLMMNVVPKQFTDERVYRWMECYRGLLDVWQLWHERAMLDVACVAYMDTIKPPAQVYARCNFCGHTLSLGMITPGKLSRATRSFGLTRPTNLSDKKQKISSCPNCNKPLPLCAVCLLPFGCSTPIFNRRGKESTYWSEGNSAFGDWFTWCQTCRHGGHAKHIMDWFSSHEECPVTDCNCKCSSY